VPTAEGSDSLPPLRAPDPSGRDRIAWNVLAGWAGYLVELGTGFVLPRMMDQHLGQATLGVWDFAWSCISYFRFAQIGVAPATSRYLARYRALGDTAGLRMVATSTVGVSTLVALLVLMLTGLAVWAMPWLSASRLGEHVSTARWVVAVLGIELAFNYWCEVFSGALTGSHRWDLHTGLNSATNVATALVMIATLSAGGGLRELAIAHASGVVIAEFIRMALAYRVMPELRIRPAYFSMEQARLVMSFGGKVSVPALAWLVMGQTNVLLVAGYLGPAALAAYARPGALLRPADNLIRKLAVVLQPTASSLDGIGRHAEIRRLVVQGVRAATALTLPSMLGLVILGGPLLLVWMGERYDQSLVLAILAIGSIPSYSVRPARAVLTGLNLHGFIAMESTVAALVGAALSVLGIVVLGLGLVGAALAVTIPQFALGLLVPVYVCRKLDLPLRDLLRQAYLPPALCAVPFGLVLLASRLVFADQPLLAVGVGSLVGGLLLLPLYWRFLTPPQLRSLVLDRLPRTPARWLTRLAS
jgi:O-antigen/teichoic acid export membrane protein